MGAVTKEELGRGAVHRFDPRPAVVDAQLRGTFRRLGEGAKSNSISATSFVFLLRSR